MTSKAGLPKNIKGGKKAKERSECVVAQKSIDVVIIEKLEIRNFQFGVILVYFIL